MNTSGITLDNTWVYITGGSAVDSSQLQSSLLALNWLGTFFF